MRLPRRRPETPSEPTVIPRVGNFDWTGPFIPLIILQWYRETSR
jgi:hypothetical protein